MLGPAKTIAYERPTSCKESLTHRWDSTLSNKTQLSFFQKIKISMSSFGANQALEYLFVAQIITWDNKLFRLSRQASVLSKLLTPL